MTDRPDSNPPVGDPVRLAVERAINALSTASEYAPNIHEKIHYALLVWDLSDYMDPQEQVEEEECDSDEEHRPIAIVHDPGLQRYAVNVALNALSEAIKRSSNLTDRLAFGSLIYAVEIYPARCKDPYHWHFLR